MAGEQSLIDLVNERIDALGLVQAIGFHVDKMRIIGRNIKTPCMIHGDERFATLIVDPNRRHFTCMVGDCRGREGGNLVQLYGLWSGTEGVAAALGAAKLLGVEIDSEAVDRALADLDAAAAEAEGRGDWPAASALLGQLAALRDDRATKNRAAQALHAEATACLARGDAEGAGEVAARAERVLGDGAASRGLALLAELAGEPGADFGERVDALLVRADSFAQPALAVLLALLGHERMAETEAAAVGLQKAVEAAVAARDGALAREVFEPFAACALTSPGDVVRTARRMADAEIEVPQETLLRAFDRHLAAVPRVSSEQVLELAAFAAGRSDSAPERRRIAEAAATLAESENRAEAAESFVAMAMEAGADRIAGLARLANLAVRGENVAKAAGLLGEAARLATEAGDGGRARELYARLFEIAPSDFDAAERYLESIEEDEVQVAEEALRFAQRAAEAREDTRAGDFARHAAIARRGDADVARRAAEVLYDVRADREATLLIVEACEAVESEKGVEDAAALAAWAVERHPASASLHRLLGQLRAKAGRVAQALREFAEAASIEEESGNFADADEILREAAELAPSNAEVLQERVDFLRRHRPKSEAAFAKALETLAWRTMEAGDAAKARAAAEELLALRPTWPALLELLVAACQAMDDTDAAARYALDLSAAYEGTDGAKALEAAKKARALGGDTLPGLARLVACGRDAAEGAEWAGWAREYAALCRKAGDLEQAAQTLRETIRRHAATRDDYAALAEVLSAGGKIDEAAAAALEGAQASLDEGDLRQGTEFLRFAESCGSQSASVLHEAGLLWIRADDSRRGAALLCKAGLALAQSRRDDDARSCLEEARRAGGLTPDAALLLAELLHRAGEGREAMRQLRECRDKMLLDANQRVTLARKMAEFDPKDARAQGDLAKALAEAGRRDEAADMHLLLARRHAEAADWHEALPHAIAARDMRPDDTGVRTTLGEVQSGLGNDAVALKEYGVAIDRLMAEKRFEQALEIVETCLAIDPNNEEMLLRSAECLRETERADEALESLLELADRAEKANRHAEALGWIERAAGLAGDDGELLERKAELLETLGRKAEAFEARLAPMRSMAERGLVEESVKWLEEYVESCADEVAVRRAAARVFDGAGIPELAAAQLLAVARTLGVEGKHEDALAAARESARLNPRGLEAREVAAASLGELGRDFEKVPLLEESARLLAEAYASERAVEVCLEILEIDPDRIEVRRLLAESLTRLDRREEAAEVLRDLGDQYEASGRVEESLAAMKNLLELRPDDTRARRRLIGEYSRTGEMPDVSQQYLLLAGTHERQGKTKEALEVLSQGLLKRPESADLLERRLRLALAAKDATAAVDSAVRLARVMLAAENPDGAARTLEQAKGEGNRMGDWHASMAETWRARNSPGAALREYEEAAALYELEQSFEKKATMLARILELDPQKLEARKERADLLRRMGRMEDASRERMELGNLYAQRSLFDLAEAEYRAVTEASPRDMAAWKALFDNRTKFGSEAGLVADYMRFARILAETGETEEALDWLGRAIRADPRGIPAREAYIEVYRKAGNEADLIEDYLALADLLVAKGEVDRGIALYSRIMELDPQHGKARDRLTETQARARGLRVPTPDVADLPTERPHETRWVRLKRRQEAKREESVDTLGDEREPAKKGAGTNRAVAARLLADEMDSLDEEENKGALLDVLKSYGDILQINPLNAGVRMKAAAILQQLDRKDEALEHLEKASEAFFEKSELNACIEACEQLLRLRPTDQKARNRLRQALNKRDAFKALESEILLGGDPRHTDDTESGRFFRPKK